MFTFLNRNLSDEIIFFIIPVKDLNEIDPDDLCDDALGSDIEGSETDSKVSDSKRNGDGKSQGNSSKPRR